MWHDIVAILIACAAIVFFPFAFMALIGLMWITAIVGLLIVMGILSSPFWAIRKFCRYWNKTRNRPS